MSVTTRRRGRPPAAESPMTLSVKEESMEDVVMTTKTNGTTTPTITQDPPETSLWKEWRSKNPGLCCICLEPEEKDDPIIACSTPNCSTVVHYDCYGLKAPKRKSSSEYKEWKCDRCSAPDPRVARCVLCPMIDGALRKVMNKSYYVHIVCALWLKEAHFMDEERFDQIILDEIDPKHWKLSCSICSTQADADFGCKVPCDAHGCKNALHITCAQNYGLLEDADDDDMQDPFFVYCKQHGPGPDSRLNVWARWVKQKYTILSKQAATIATKTESESDSTHDFILHFQNQFDEMNASQEQKLVQTQHDRCLADAETRSLKEQIAKMETEMEEADKEEQEMLLELQSLKVGLTKLQDEAGKVLSKLFGGGASEGGKSRNESVSPATTDPLQFVKELLKRKDLKLPESVGLKTLMSQLIEQEKTSPITTVSSPNKRKRGNPNRRISVSYHAVGTCNICGVDKRATDSPEPRAEGKKSQADNLIKCEDCMNVFHWGCLDPPINKRHPRGYLWRCHECDAKFQAEEDEEEEGKTPEVVEEELGRSLRKRRASAKAAQI
ncbi:PHD finger protein 14 [Blyttiomyces sp. JEL0837]|nr:PHD finger protein 14 [Blyttiomyces sp. JEL0837]